MANPQAYLLPQPQSFLYPSYRDQLSEQQQQQQQQQPASTSSSPITSVSSSNIAQSSFRAPAHKHAHHLHSIPPREKSTRTLIIDHMLWVHGKGLFFKKKNNSEREAYQFCFACFLKPELVLRRQERNLD